MGRMVAGLAQYPLCAFDGEASIALKGSQGNTLTSLAGVTLAYSTLDNVGSPRNGLYAELKPDVAGLGGQFQVLPCDGQAPAAPRNSGRTWSASSTSRRGKIPGPRRQPAPKSQTSSSSAHRSSAASPRTVSARATSASPTADRTRSAARPTWAARSRCSSPIWGIPRDLGLKGAVFADAGTLFGYHGRRTFNVNGNSFINGVAPGGACSFNAFTLGVEPECVNVHNSATIRSSIGASILWNSPLGPIRFDLRLRPSPRSEGVRVPGDEFPGW